MLLEACRKYGNIRRFINVSTDEVYGETSLGKDQGKLAHLTPMCMAGVAGNEERRQ